jgi:hypothetical protein
LRLGDEAEEVELVELVVLEVEVVALLGDTRSREAGPE